MEKIYSHTMALCPECRKKISAKIIEEDNKIFLKKFCPEHGFSSALICSDPAWYNESLFYIKPKQNPKNTKIEEYKGCPESCGLCPEHQQHTCLPVIEITDTCNLSCPVCLKNFKEPFQLTEPEFEHIIDSLFEYEGKVDVVNLSGGEPTLHPDFEKFLKINNKKGVNLTTVSTNGLTLLKNKKLRKLFKETNSIVALQFDGFKPETYTNLRGEDLSKKKQDILTILEDEDIKYSLVATIAKGINDKEITDITEFFFKSKALSLMFQPIAFTGHAAEMDIATNRITVPDIIKNIEKCRYVDKGDFNPLPCSHFSCFALSYYISIENANFISLKEFLGKEKYINMIANKSLPGLDNHAYSLIKERIYELWSAADSSGPHEMVIEKIRNVLREMSSTEFSSKQSLSYSLDSIKAIFIHHFMDIHSMDFGRLMKCCNPYPKADGRIIPMCAENVFFQ